MGPIQSAQCRNCSTLEENPPPAPRQRERADKAGRSASQQSVQQTHTRRSRLNGISHRPRRWYPSIGGVAASFSAPPPPSPLSLPNSLHSKSMHAIYRGTLCQGEQMYKINILAVCATTRAMIPESHKSGQRVALARRWRLGAGGSGHAAPPIGSGCHSSIPTPPEGPPLVHKYAASQLPEEIRRLCTQSDRCYYLTVPFSFPVLCRNTI